MNGLEYPSNYLRLGLTQSGTPLPIGLTVLLQNDNKLTEYVYDSVSEFITLWNRY